jgi:hypothetical protein
MALVPSRAKTSISLPISARVNVAGLRAVVADRADGPADPDVVLIHAVHPGECQYIGRLVVGDLDPVVLIAEIVRHSPGVNRGGIGLIDTERLDSAVGKSHRPDRMDLEDVRVVVAAEARVLE